MMVKLFISCFRFRSLYYTLHCLSIRTELRLCKHLNSNLIHGVCVCVCFFLHLAFIFALLLLSPSFDFVETYCNFRMRRVILKVVRIYYVAWQTIVDNHWWWRRRRQTTDTNSRRFEYVAFSLAHLWLHTHCHTHSKKKRKFNHRVKFRSDYVRNSCGCGSQDSQHCHCCHVTFKTKPKAGKMMKRNKIEPIS